MERVIVLMSTYNGEKYLREQLDSVFSQKGVDVDVIVRDDGSKDKTIEILQEYKNKKQLTFYSGENLKPARSFMDLIYKAPEANYYAFCDQDDVWEKTKLLNAVNMLRSIQKPALYYHAMDIVDENLQSYGYYFRQEEFAKSLRYSALFGDEIAGCTMVFNKELLTEVRKYHPCFITMHDGWIHRVCLVVSGEIVADSTPYIKYRQHGTNAVGMKDRTLYDMFSKLNRKDKRFSKLAYEMVNGYGEAMSEDNKQFLYALAGQKNLKSKAYILSSAKTICEDRTLIMKLVIKLLCNSF